MTNSKFCSKCGEEISLNAKFCLKCGARQEKFEENSSSSVNKELGKGFNLEISTFKELKKAENQFDFSFFRYRRFGNIIVSTHQTCTSILENMLRVVGGFSRFFGSGTLLFDKKIDINSITAVTRIKNWDKYNLILGSIMLFIALICLFTAEIWYFLGWALVGGLVIYNARGMKLSIHQTNGEQTAFQTWNLGDEQKFITELKKINLNITENLENENLNLNNVLDNETIENLKEKYVGNSDFWKRNIGGIAVSIVIIIISCFNRFSEGYNSQALLFIFVSPLSIFLSTIGWKIGNKFAESFAPDAVLYSCTSDLIKKKLFWKIGPQIIGAAIGTFIPYMLFGFLFGVEID